MGSPLFVSIGRARRARLHRPRQSLIALYHIFHTISILLLQKSVYNRKVYHDNTAQFAPYGLSTAATDLRAKSRRKRRLRSEAPRCGSVCEAQSALQKCSIIHTSIICAFCLAACTSRSLHRHLELCGIALRQCRTKPRCIGTWHCVALL